MRKLYFALGVLCLVLCLVCVYLFIPKPAPVSSPLVREASLAVEKQWGSGTSDNKYKSPVDFQTLQDYNPDIYAWLYIPGAGINNPILQSSSGDGNYYLTHNVERKEDENGCLYTQNAYCGRDFEEPLVVVYGHRRRSGEMFGTLEKQLSSKDGIYKYNTIIIYTPERELRYQVFGQTQFNNTLIPFAYHNFAENKDLADFMDDINNYHTLSRQFDEDVSITPDDKLLVLSTCLVDYEKQRFLVLAKLVEEIN